jgi:hypothetical protein
MCIEEEMQGTETQQTVTEIHPNLEKQMGPQVQKDFRT